MERTNMWIPRGEREMSGKNREIEVDMGSLLIP